MYFGPFYVKCSYDNVTYTKTVLNQEGKDISDSFHFCDKNGNSKSLEGNKGKFEFYLLGKEDAFAGGIGKISLNGTRKGNIIRHWTEVGNPKFYKDVRHQIVKSNYWGLIAQWDEKIPSKGQKTLTWTKINSFLEVTKCDADDNNIVLKDVTIRVTGKDYDETQVTNTKGKVKFENLEMGRTYKIEEISNNQYGYREVKEVGKIVINKGSGGKIINYNLENVKQTGNLRLNKIDTDSGKPLSGFGFKLKSVEKGQYVIAVKGTEKQKTVKGTIFLDDIAYTQNIEEATEFLTDENGSLNICNILVGKYEIIETSVGENKYYDVDGDYITWTFGDKVDQKGNNAPITIQRQKSNFTREDNKESVEHNDQITIKNRRKYIDLTGMVWLDKADVHKQNRVNSLYKDNSDDIHDLLLKGIKVELVHTGPESEKYLEELKKNPKDPQLTDESGKYFYEKVLIDELKYYEVRFSYNGMSYESVNPILEKPNGSKASELTKADLSKEGFADYKGVSPSRDEFNENYATISKGKSNKYDLNYDTTEDYKSKLLFNKDGKNYNYGNEADAEGRTRGPVSGVDEQYIIQASTYVANGGFIDDKIITADTIRKNDVTIIENLNLGIKERAMPDISLIQDVDNAVVGLKSGYQYTYKYAKRYQSLEKQIEEFKKNHPDNEIFNVQASFGKKGDLDENGERTYTTNIYPSDVIFDEKNTEELLTVDITYQVVLRNESGEVHTRVNELCNYFDNRYTIDKIWIVNADGSIADASNEITWDKDTEPNSGGEGLQKAYIHLGNSTRIGANKSQTMYITYKLSNEAAMSLLSKEATLDAYTEVASYSSFSDDAFSKVYAGVDKDSAPDNTNLKEDRTFEDDIDKAPSLILHSVDDRKISGNVWEDNAIEDLLKSDKIGYDRKRMGNGQFEDTAENVVENVDVQLLRLNDEKNKDQMLDTPIPAILYQMDKDGKTIAVDTKDNPVTTSKEGHYEFAGVIPGKYILKYTYKNDSVFYTVGGDKIGSIEEVTKKDGVEDAGVQYYKSTLYRASADNSGNVTKKDGGDNLNWYARETSKAAATDPRLSDAKDEDKIVEMRTTAGLISNKESMEMAKLDKISADTSTLEVQIDYTPDNDFVNMCNYGEKLVFEFDRIDFGIVRRPKQDLVVKKEISYIKITMDRGDIITEGDPRTGKLDYVSYLPNGDIYITLDDEILEGALFEITYDISVDNTNCEIDYNDKDHYIYGIVPADKENKFAIATVERLFDYPSNKLAFDSAKYEENINWKRVDIDGLTQLEQEGKLAQGLAEILKKNYATILETEQFKTMKPGEKHIEKLTLSKILSASEKDTAYRNDAEVITYQGRKTDNTNPGNYNPIDKTNNENDNDGKEATVTDPAGSNKNYIPYIAVGIVAFIALGTGIIFIKRKAIK